VESAAAIDRAEVRTAEQREDYEDEAQAHQALMERISAAGVTTLGHVATVITFSEATSHTTGDSTQASTPDSHHDDQAASHPNEPEKTDDPDTFPWTDAARWTPNGGQDELARDRLDVLFGEIPDEEIGSVEDIGWFGLLRHRDRPGVVLSQNSYGFRQVWETDSDEQLAQYWGELQREYDAFIEATRGQSRETDDRQLGEAGRRDETASGHHPEIWVGSLSDYNNGRLHGVWLDATLDPDELCVAIAFILRNGYDPTAEEWGIFDYKALPAPMWIIPGISRGVGAARWARRRA